MKKSFFLFPLFIVLLVGCNVMNSCKNLSKDSGDATAVSDKVISDNKSNIDTSFMFYEKDMKFNSDGGSYVAPSVEEAGSSKGSSAKSKAVFVKSKKINNVPKKIIGNKNSSSLQAPIINDERIISGDGVIKNPFDLMGVVAYYIPDTMKVNVEYIASIRISKELSRDILIGFIDSSSVISKQIRVGERMEVKLVETNSSIENFKITALSSGIQNIENDSSYTTWEWSIRPVKCGVHKLKMIVVIKGDGFTKDIPVYENSIFIKSSPVFTIETFFVNNWQYMLSTIIIPFIIFLWRKRKKETEG